MIDYNLAYYYNVLKLNSSTAELINTIRWHWVKECNAKYVLDYGCGPGWFRAFSPNGAVVDTYDIMKVPQTGITRRKYDLVCFWDVLEHIYDLNVPKKIIENAEHCAVTIPIKGDNIELEQWKHYKPGEHLNYFSLRSILEFMASCGMVLNKMGQPECPPREDIYSFLFDRGKDES